MMYTTRRTRFDKEGKPCGKGFISADKECRAGEGVRSPQETNSKGNFSPEQTKSFQSRLAQIGALLAVSGVAAAAGFAVGRNLTKVAEIPKEAKKAYERGAEAGKAESQATINDLTERIRTAQEISKNLREIMEEVDNISPGIFEQADKRILEKNRQSLEKKYQEAANREKLERDFEISIDKELDELNAVRKRLEDLFKRSDSLRLDKNGKPCGKGYISASKECRAGEGSMQSPKSQKYKKFSVKEIRDKYRPMKLGGTKEGYEKNNLGDRPKGYYNKYWSEEDEASYSYDAIKYLLKNKNHDYGKGEVYPTDEDIKEIQDTRNDIIENRIERGKTSQQDRDYESKGLSQSSSRRFSSRKRRDSLRLDKGKPCGKGFISENKECRSGKGEVRSPKATYAKAEKRFNNASDRYDKARKPSNSTKVDPTRVAVALGILIIASAGLGMAELAIKEEAERRRQQSNANTKRNWWDVLGVKPDATPEEIRKAYKQKARDFHPDVSKDPGAEEMMKEVNDAFDRSGQRKRRDALMAPDIVQRIRGSLKRIIEEVFGEFNAVLSFELGNNGTISGKFRDLDDLYDYEISPTDELSYVESSARADSYMIGYFLDSGMALTTAFRKDYRKKKCKDGKPCKGTCIQKGLRCRVQLENRDRAILRQVRNAIAQVQDRKTETVERAPSPQNVSQEFKVSPLAAAGAIAGAALLAMPIAGYMAVRARYREGFQDSANQAKIDAPQYADYVPDELRGGWAGRNGKPADQITLVVGGFAGEGGSNATKWVEQFEGKDERFDNHHLVAVSNEDFEIPGDANEEPVLKVGDQTILTDRNVAQFRTMLGTTLERGRNPAAIRMAATAYAFRQKHPTQPINLMGYSAGGMVTHEAAELLDRMGVKDVRVANFGSPYWGLTEKVGPSVTFGSNNDPGLGNVPVRDRVNVNSVADHFSYLKNPQVRQQLDDFFGGSQPATSDNPFPDSFEQSTPEERRRAERRQRASARAERARANRKRRTKTDSYNEAFKRVLEVV